MYLNCLLFEEVSCVIDVSQDKIQLQQVLYVVEQLLDYELNAASCDYKVVGDLGRIQQSLNQLVTEYVKA